jgi:hypothetical protein
VSAIDPEASVREALASVRQYLSDSIPPLTAAQAVTLLLEQAPELVASEIRSWIAAQYGRASARLSVSDYVFHALKKLHEMGQLKLVPAETLSSYLEVLKVLVLDFCPAEERASIRQSLDNFEQTETVLSPAIGFLHRRVDAVESQTDGAGAESESMPAALQDVESLRRGRRFSLLLERLQRESPAVRGRRAQPLEAGEEQFLRTLAAATSNARTESEFQQIQKTLMTIGTGSGTKEVFQRLSRSLPAWCVSVTAEPGADTRSPTQNPALAAMLQIMRLAEERQETGKRFPEIVQAGIEQFNAGSLGKAVTMLELADSLVAEGKIDADVVARTRSSAHEALDFNRLRACAEKPETHFLLKRVMSHFNELTPESLLGKLRIEPKRDRRRMLLNLLEAHGPAARLAAFQQLEEEAGAGAVAQSWYFPRNLICILNRIPPEEETDLDKEVALVGSFLKLSYPAPLVREAMTHLGQIHHGAEEQLLLNVLGELERRLLKTDTSDPEAARLQSLLDRLISVLARYGTPGAYRAVVDHGLTRREELGDTLARLACLAGEDLAGEEESVARLLSGLKARTPIKLLGVVIHKDIQDPLHLVKALSSTPTPAVCRAFEHLAKNFPHQEFGKAAARALKGFAAGTRTNEAPTEKLLGDLELLSLPDLLQQLARSRLTGMLALKDQRGEAVGTVTLQRGLLIDCRTGLLEGRAAVYQLLVKPIPGTFVFMRRKNPGAGEPDEPPGQELAPLIQEGTRRHDELQRARALVPDGCRLKPTGTEPRPRPDEEDPALFRRVWNRASSGASPDDCEADSPADAYQTRLLLARWVEEAHLATQ